MAIKFTNNAFATLAASINSSVTSISLAAGTGGRFPSLGVGDYFYATLVDASNNLEIIKVTARSTDTLTVVRGQDSSTARSFAAGDRIELRPVAAVFDDIQVYTPSGSISATTVQGAIAELDTEKAPIASPTFTGTPAAPTASAGTNTTQLATTAFVTGALTDERTATATLTNKTLTSPNVSGLQVTDSSIVFEGATADAYETTLAVTDPTADRTITIPDATTTMAGTDATQTLTNKTIALGSNTVSGTKAEFNAALTDGDFSFGSDFTGGGQQSLSTDGYQKLPGGLILQWGYTGPGSATTFPIPFPNAALQAFPVVQNTSGSSYAPSHSYVSTLTTTGFTRLSQAFAIRWFAIGY